MSYSSVLMMKARRFLYITPLLSFPMLCTLETGILLYVLSSSMSIYFINYVLYSVRMRKILNIPEYLPGTKLEKLVYI